MQHILRASHPVASFIEGARRTGSPIPVACRRWAFYPFLYTLYAQWSSWFVLRAEGTSAWLFYLFIYLFIFFAPTYSSFVACIAVTDSENTMPRHMSPDIMMALQGVRFIAQHIKDADKDNEVRTYRAHAHTD